MASGNMVTGVRIKLSKQLNGKDFGDLKDSQVVKVSRFDNKWMFMYNACMMWKTKKSTARVAIAKNGGKWYKVFHSKQ